MCLSFYLPALVMPSPSCTLHAAQEGVTATVEAMAAASVTYLPELLQFIYDLFDRFLDPMLSFLRAHCSEAMPSSDINLVTSVAQIFSVGVCVGGCRVTTPLWKVCCLVAPPRHLLPELDAPGSPASWWCKGCSARGCFMRLPVACTHQSHLRCMTLCCCLTIWCCLKGMLKKVHTHSRFAKFCANSPIHTRYLYSFQQPYS